MLALIKDTEIITTVPEGSWTTLPNGDRLSPAQDGWGNDTYRLETVQEPDPTPEGKVVDTSELKLVEGHPTRVNTFKDAPVHIPKRVSRRQFGLQLMSLNLKDSVDTWVETQDDATQWAYNESATFYRDDPMMQAGFTAMGFSKEDIDDFYVAAAKL